MAERKLRVAFLHPGLGLGGAERWVAEAAAALQHRGHRIAVWTCSFDRDRCFAPFQDGRIDIQVRAAWLPSAILGRLRAPCNILRVAALSHWLGAHRKDFDVIIADLVSHALPLLKARSRRPVAFYCHYPDLLLTPRRRALYAVYRRPIDWLEERGLAAADRVWVNSRFTAAQFARTFPAVPAPRTLYPGVDTDTLAAIPEICSEGPIRLLALGRFDPAKNLELAVETLAALQARLPTFLAARLRLQLAGALDQSRGESLRVVQQIRQLATELRVGDQVEILPNPSERERIALLSGCRCLLHTARGEHFGLAPVEAMAAGRPVVAVAEGGPCETIADSSGGRLRPPVADAFADAATEWITDPAAARGDGAAGQSRAQVFSRERMGDSLESEILEAVGG